MGLSELKYNWVLLLTNDLLVVIFSNHHKISFIFENCVTLCHNLKKKKKKKKTRKIGVHHMLLKCLENQHKWERTNNIAKIYAGLEIKKNSKLPFGNYQRKKWLPNTKMQLPDSTRTETQIGSPFN